MSDGVSVVELDSLSDPPLDEDLDVDLVPILPDEPPFDLRLSVA